jgi:hypothetical protein
MEDVSWNMAITFSHERAPVISADRIRRRFKLRDFDTIAVVAQCGSMAKAAAQLSLTQPAISKSIDEMEHVLGVRLFDRTTKGVEPTMYGRVMIKWASAIFDDVRQSVKEIEFLADPTAGELRIGATAPMFSGFLPVVFQRLHRSHPKIDLRVMEVSTPQQHRDLRERRIDLTVSRLSSREPPDDIETEALFDDRSLSSLGLGVGGYTGRRCAFWISSASHGPCLHATRSSAPWSRNCSLHID